MSQPESSYRSALSELLSLEFTGMKLGLDNIRELLRILGNPQDKFESIHIAGSNGKGSVSALLAAALQSNKYLVGLYTSPHLVDFRERIKINGKVIAEEYITSFAAKIWPDVQRLSATFFEVTTALAFCYFADNGVQVAVIETGLGGRLDATNILEKPLATVITSISLEHTAQLGDTLELIAAEKAGIMKHGSPAIVNVSGELQKIFSAKSQQLVTNVKFVDSTEIFDGYSELESPFVGKHQAANLRTALVTLESLEIPLKLELTIEGIRLAVELTGIRARLEYYNYPPAAAKGVNLILDVGHNPDAFRMLRQYFNDRKIRPIVVAGFAGDKDIQLIVQEMAGFAGEFISVAARAKRAIPSGELAALVAGCGLDATMSDDPLSGVELALSTAKRGDTILLTGSHFVVGDFLADVESTETV
ncbi:MAG: folylpolyglutamate synthase/dihydrofolate synthase family protein [Ignavibacteriota bacterium]